MSNIQAQLSEDYVCPTHWYDNVWLEQRQDLLSYFDRSAHINLDFGACFWLDLHPLADLVLQLGTAVAHGKDIHLRFRTQENPDAARVLAFLNETGFFLSLNEDTPSGSSEVQIIVDGNNSSLKDFLIRGPALVLPKRALDWDALVPCRFLNGSRFPNREEVFEFCYGLREEALASGRAAALRLPVSLIQQAKLFFHSVLPELIDNIRLHKSTSADSYFSLLVRVRRRTHRTVRIRRLAEPSPPNLTLLRFHTAHYWQNDILEAVVADSGKTIQETYKEAWIKRPENRRRKVPRLPTQGSDDRGIRVDGPNGDELLLQSVFNTNVSSFLPAERRALGLPELTGLHVLRNAMRGSNYGIGVRSGRNYAVVLGEVDSAPSVRPGGRYHFTPGVHFFIRVGSLEGSGPVGWLDGIPPEGLETAVAWWTYDYPERFSRSSVIHSYEIPVGVRRGDVVICRPHQTTTKTHLYLFLNAAYQRGVNIVFFEVPTPIALWLFETLTFLTPREVPIECPIVSNTYHLMVPGDREQEAAVSFRSGIARGRAHWWTSRESPIKNLPETVRRVRQSDSVDFWRLTSEIEGAFLSEPVKWSQDLVLLGGYLTVPATLTNRKIQKLLRKRLVCLAHGLRLKRLIADSEHARHLANDLGYSAELRERDSSRVGIVASVQVTGGTILHAGRTLAVGEKAIAVPAFVYPSFLVEPRSRGRVPSEVTPRAFDWHPNAKELRKRLVAVPHRLARRGGTGIIRQLAEDSPEAALSQQRADTFAVWDRLNLLQLGHFSYGEHHYFVWIDLLRFMGEKTAEAQEMSRRLLRTIARWRPSWVFYFQHEVADALLERLVMEQEEGGHAPWRLWPIGELETFAATFMRSDRDARTVKVAARGETALLLDDAVVTGRHLRRARELLHKLGFERVYSLTLLDRGNSGFSGGAFPMDEHQSGWSLRVGPIGSSSHCPICDALDLIQATRSHTRSDQVRIVLGEILMKWAEADHLSRYRNLLENRSLGEFTLHLGGSAKVDAGPFRSTASASAWLLDFIAGHGNDSLFIRGGITLPDVIRITILAGLVFQQWAELEEADQAALTAALLDSVWTEEQGGDRELAMLALIAASKLLPQKVLDQFGSRARERGIVNLDLAILGLLLSEREMGRKETQERIFRSWSPVQDSGMDAEARRKTTALVNVLRSSSSGAKQELLALELLGIPGRGRDHQHFYSLLALGEDRPLSLQPGSEDSEILLACLEPIWSAIEEEKELLRRTGIYELARESVERLRGLLRSKPFPIPVTWESEIGKSCKETMRVLFRQPGFEKLNVRQILASEFLHYSPYFTRLHIAELVGSGKDVEARDFEVTARILEVEGALLSGRFAKGLWERHALEEDLLSEDVVICGRARLRSIVWDLLTDVKHPKRTGKGLGPGNGPPFIRVKFEWTKPRGGNREFLSMVVENSAVQEEVDRAIRGRSWAIIQDLSRQNGGSSNLEFPNGLLVRRVNFPYLGRPSASGVQENEE